MESNKFILTYLLSLIFLIVSCSEQGAEKSPRSASLSRSQDSNLTTSAADTNAVIPAAGQSTAGSAGSPDSVISESRSNAITRAVQKVSPAVVSITVTEVMKAQRRVYDEFFNRFFIPTEREYSSMGSGFIISEDGLVVTNQHVASTNAKKIVVSLTDGSQYEAEIVGTDALADLALLRIKADRKFPYVEFGDSDEVMVGEWSLAIGNPFGLFKAAQPSVTVGVVSALHRDFHPNPNEPRVYLDMIQTDAAINSGNSGGPLVNSQGKVIGVNTFIFTGGTSGGFVGLGFAIPSNRVQKIIRQLASTGEVKTEYDLGMETTPMTYNMAIQNNLPAIFGLFVNSVNRDGPAFKSGIMPGDILLRIGDERVQSQMHAQALFREYDVGDTMRIQLLRDSSLYEAKIKLRAKADKE